jgi:hypothetical protein
MVSSGAVVLLLVGLVALLIRVRSSANAWAERAPVFMQRYASAASRIGLDAMVKDIALRRGEPLQPITRAPRLATFKGIGTQLYGHNAEDVDTGSYATTQWLTVVWLPLVPLARFLAGSTRWQVIGQLPLRTGDWLLAAAGWALLLVGLLSYLRVL